MSTRLSDPAIKTTLKVEIHIGISYATCWNNERNPPKNGYLLLLAQAKIKIIDGKSEVIAKTKTRPTSRLAITQCWPNGITAKGTAARTTRINGMPKNNG